MCRYYKYGIKIFWLDASEPEGFGPLSTNATWSLGSMRDMGSMFTLYWTQVFYDGLRSHNETDIVMLPRAGWVGTWRHGAVLWSGDIGSTMPVLKSQINIGVSAQTSGIPWWTTDVGGYHGGNSQDPSYRETVTRWFQYGMTCPMLRQHGARDHTCPWYYGNESETIIEDIIRLRHAMKPYFSAQLDLLNETGRPFNRPLFWDFPGDRKTWALAENGIGDTPTNSTPGPPVSITDGSFVVLQPCNTTSPNQQWNFDASTGHFSIVAAGAGYVMDRGGNKGKPPPNGPYPVHMWESNKQFAPAQRWELDSSAGPTAIKVAAQNLQCLTTGDGTHPDVSGCDKSDPKQQFRVTEGGTISSRSGCLSVVTASGGGGGGGVIDQYMMGDDYMAAPVLNLGQRVRNVYFPIGADWVHHYTGVVYKGGTTAAVPAPLNTFPLFLRTTPSNDA